MRRERSSPRRGWQQTVAAQGLPFHTPEGRTYWDESVCYRFSVAEVDVIEKATNDLQQMCLAAAQHVIDQDRFAEFGIPTAAVLAIRAAWNAEPPSIYGRFDLAYDGVNPPKMLEYNANTPTSLVEAAVIQWNWLEETHPGGDQFNSIHEKLIAQWQEIRPYLKAGPLYLTGVDDVEDIMTLAYLDDVAQQAGIETARIAIGDLGWNEGAREFRDLEERAVRNVFALYPWEWLLGEYPDALLAVLERDIWIEPVWKMLWSNKALLAVLWELYPEHENLLEARLDGPGRMAEYVRKPLLSREGANISLRTRAGLFETGGEYGEEGYVYQAAAKIPNLAGTYPVIGIWVVTDQGACGMGVRESDGPITDTLSRFVPHYME
jgi:glutathionylspermidine synthase